LGDQFLHFTFLESTNISLVGLTKKKILASKTKKNTNILYNEYVQRFITPL